MTVTEIFDTNPTVCAVCGERPGTVRMVFAAGPQRRAAMLCETCATEPCASARPQPRSPHSTSSVSDLTAAAAAGRIDPVIGRADEIAQTIEILARRRKNNAVLIGEAGVGKTAIAEGLALRIHEGSVPETLKDTRIFALDLSGMVAGAQYRGQFEQRLKKALEAAIDDKTILFLDELHTLLGAGNAQGGMDAANILKPLLARGELRVIGATTLAEYRTIERDSALARRFSPVTVEEPSVEDTITILEGLRPAYETHHAVLINDEALEAAARLSDRYITEYHLPDKAIDLIDQAAAKLRLNGGGVTRADLDQAIADEDFEKAAWLKRKLDENGPVEVSETEIATVVAARTGIPVGELIEGELERLNELETDLHDPRDRPGRGRRGRRGHDPPRPRGPLRGRPPARAASCSSAPPASARPSWSRRSRSGCSRPRRRWSGSTCPSSARRTRWRG